MDSKGEQKVDNSHLRFPENGYFNKTIGNAIGNPMWYFDTWSQLFMSHYIPNKYKSVIHFEWVVINFKI